MKKLTAKPTALIKSLIHLDSPIIPQLSFFYFYLRIKT